MLVFSSWRCRRETSGADWCLCSRRFYPLQMTRQIKFRQSPRVNSIILTTYIIFTFKLVQLGSPEPKAAEMSPLLQFSCFHLFISCLCICILKYVTCILYTGYSAHGPSKIFWHICYLFTLKTWVLPEDRSFRDIFQRFSHIS